MHDGEEIHDQRLRCPACKNPEVGIARSEAHYFAGPEVMALKGGAWVPVQPGALDNLVCWRKGMGLLSAAERVCM